MVADGGQENTSNRRARLGSPSARHKFEHGRSTRMTTNAANDIVRISRAMVDSTLIKGFDSDIFERDQEHALEGMQRVRRADPVGADFFPEVMWYSRIEASKAQDPEKQPLPPLFLGGGYWVASKQFVETLQHSDLGQTAFFPVELFAYDRKMPVEGTYFCVAFGETKDTFLPDLSPRMRRPYPEQDVWRLSLDPQDDDAALTSAALSGVDLWMEPRVREAIFFSDRLVKALRANKMTRRLGLRKCRVTRSN